MKRPSLALAMIVKNEAHNLFDLFNSIDGCFDEIHITDTGSTDDTVELAKRLGAQVHHFKWCDDFSAARNASFEPVKTDFVMWLDGDDALLNKDHFIMWRDNVMGLFDYWLATYHYSWDAASDRPICSFARERVFNKSKNPVWKYFLHEGVVPDASWGAQPKANFVSTWAVKHRRSASDLAADQSRNVSIFEKRKDDLDPRMQYYYGKELFEAHRHIDSIKVLEKAVKEPTLELHDRVLGLQYLSYALFQCNQYPQTIQTAHQGLQLDPSRAEFYCLIGDCYLKQGNLAASVPYFSAAKNCGLKDASKTPTPIFSNEALYTTYPRNQLSRVFANATNIDAALKEASETQSLYRDNDSKALVDELTKIKGTITIDNAKDCDDIVISCPPTGPYEWDADIAKEKGMGGSETAAIELAANLKRITGRPVKILNVRQASKVCDGVEYLSNANIHEYFKANKPWLHIAWRHNMPLTKAKTLLWCHDLYTQGGENHANYAKIMALTPFHKRFLQAIQAIPEEKIHVFRNGIRPERFKDQNLVHKDQNKVVFTSSPDRGLDRAMRVMDKVREKYPNLELHVFYGLENLHKYGLSALATKLEGMMKERPWVKYHGFTQQDKLMQHLKEAVVWCHPCDFIETFCITALEMLCSGVYPVTRRLGGLMDTLAKAEAEGMATLIDSDCITETEYQLYVDAMLDALDNKKWEKVKVDPEQYSWEAVTKELLADLPKLLEG